ncbi:hypothetical protein CD30_02975 [Ureibacillus massiliensis 4400831 = CIP 108448 = CCUG 49529]|uniref:Uncharacterized protein n=1 Tax=Ureibacillus massiliensis 4400831 = CIP 108448 = CCUG 49529 TaxID=1211035 RepID=A0A0A3J806_9BACL|nr:hypothetical protein [Ureibacillus massiliensis]KGR91885.1 hypothetical protein CD30_02975 [Ureibacillus massiliensis 4400831 = CIP 108448 = CCUG 49529]
MKNIDILKSFYEKISNDKSMIFNYSKVSEFERNLFISISNFINDKYGYQLKGLTKLHFSRLKNAIDIENDDKALIQNAFKLNSMIAKRTVTMGYGGYAEKKIIKNYKLEIFIEDLKEYIEEYERKNLT